MIVYGAGGSLTVHVCECTSPDCDWGRQRSTPEDRHCPRYGQPLTLYRLFIPPRGCAARPKSNDNPVDKGSKEHD